MRTRRQNIQLELALEPVAKGEARSPDTQGTEARTAHAEPERPGGPCRLTPSNRRVRTRTHGGVGGEEPRGSPYPDCATALWVLAPHYWGALSLSAMMARARWVRSSFSLGVNRMSPLTQRLISRVAISVMRICSPRSVMEMAPEISIACWHSRMDIVGGEGGMRGRSASSMMARDFLVSSSWLARGSRISPQTQCCP